MEPADETVRRLKRCSQPPGRSRAWPCNGLHVHVHKFKGPINGEHDSYWYVRDGKYWLHLVDGYAWHTGLPRESILVASESITVRGWVFEDIVGIDLSGRSNDRNYWRWFGAPVAEAIEYRGVSRESADYFDAIIETTCFGSPGRRIAALSVSANPQEESGHRARLTLATTGRTLTRAAAGAAMLFGCIQPRVFARAEAFRAFARAAAHGAFGTKNRQRAFTPVSILRCLRRFPI